MSIFGCKEQNSNFYVQWILFSISTGTLVPPIQRF